MFSWSCSTNTKRRRLVCKPFVCSMELAGKISWAIKTLQHNICFLFILRNYTINSFSATSKHAKQKYAKGGDRWNVRHKQNLLKVLQNCNKFFWRWKQLLSEKIMWFHGHFNVLCCFFSSIFCRPDLLKCSNGRFH